MELWATLYRITEALGTLQMRKRWGPGAVVLRKISGESARAWRSKPDDKEP